jgi:hypothetical protein
MRRLRQLIASHWWLSPALLVVATLYIFSLLGQIPHPASPAKIQPQPAPAPIISPVAPTANPVITASPVLDLFSPDAATLAHDQSHARVQNTIEQLLISAMILEHCGMINGEQHQQLAAAGWHYATRAKLADTPTALTVQFQQLQIRAQQSYALIYEHPESCQDPELPTLRAALLAWQARIMSASTPRPN